MKRGTGVDGGANNDLAFMSSKLKALDLPSSSAVLLNDTLASDMHMSDSAFESSMRTARTLFCLRAPLFFHESERHRHASARSLSFYLRSLVNRSSRLRLVSDLDNSISGAPLLVGLNVCGRIVVFRVSCRRAHPSAAVSNGGTRHVRAEGTGSGPLAHSAVLGLDVLLLAQAQPDVADACLSASFAQELSRLVSRIQLAGFAVNDTATRAYEALASDRGQAAIHDNARSPPDDSFSDLNKLQAFRSFFFPVSSAPSAFSSRHLKTHSVVYKRLAMDVSKLTKAGLSHGVEVTLPVLVRYVADPERAASVYGCAGRFCRENISKSDHPTVARNNGPAAANSDGGASCYFVFSPVTGTLATAAARSIQGVDSLEIFIIYNQALAIHHQEKQEGGNVDNALSDRLALQGARGGAGGGRKRSPFTVSMLWGATRRWLQRKLSLAAAHLLRDSLWHIARTKGLEEKQHAHLMRRIVRNNVEDIDPEFATLFSLQLFSDEMEGGKAVMLSLFEYLSSFYGEAIGWADERPGGVAAGAGGGGGGSGERWR